ncbi:MAG: sugar transferase [Bacteroidetes bacterium]|nr:sugar transferase [Bacteroidota bacterium]
MCLTKLPDTVPGLHSSYDRIKRLGDVVLAALLLVLGLPALVLVAVLIVAENGRPVFFRQTRIGRGSVPFEILKFRTLRPGAHDPGNPRYRVTRVGRVLRRWGLDELPQLWNVLRGEMSLVGPRPERPEFVDKLAETIPFYVERHSVKPGVTGWAQVRYSYAASEEDATEKLQYDLYYVKNHSLLLDLAIILQTVEVILWSKGAR